MEVTEKRKISDLCHLDIDMDIGILGKKKGLRRSP